MIRLIKRIAKLGENREYRQAPVDKMVQRRYHQVAQNMWRELENKKVNENMEYAVLGGGALGLMAAYRLAQGGQAVMVFEQEQTAGGLAAGFRVGPG